MTATEPPTQSPGRATVPWSWYSDPAILAARDGADLPLLMAVRRPPRRAAGPGQLLRLEHRPGADRDHPRRRRRAARLRQRLPPPRRDRRDRRTAPRARSSARTTRGPTASTAALRAAPRGERGSRASTPAAMGLVPVSVGTWGPFVFANPDPLTPSRSRTRSAIFRRSWPSTGSTSTRCGSTAASTTRSAPTGRSRSRTTSSATTARSTIRACRGPRRAPAGAPRRRACGPASSPRSIRTRSTAAARSTRTARSARPRTTCGSPTLKFNVLPGHPNLSIGPLWPTGPDTCAGYLDYWFGDNADRIMDRRRCSCSTPRSAPRTPRWSRPPSGARQPGMIDRGWVLGGAETLIGHFQDYLRDRLGLDRGVAPRPWAASRGKPQPSDRLFLNRLANVEHVGPRVCRSRRPIPREGSQAISVLSGMGPTCQTSDVSPSAVCNHHPAITYPSSPRKGGFDRPRSQRTPR